MVRRFCASFLLLCSLLMLSCSAAAAPRQAPAPVSYPDVKSGAWYFSTVMSMTGKGWLAGFEDGTFRPDSVISAAEFVTVAARAAGLSPSPVSRFSGWAAGHLQAAMERGWFDWDEIPPDSGAPGEPLSRQLAAKIIMRALLPDLRGDYAVQSAKIRDFDRLNGRYYEPVLAAYAYGVLTGDENGYFSPEGTLTRAAACSVVWRAWECAQGRTPAGPQNPAPPDVPSGPVQTVSGGVSENGRLQVIGNRLCSAAGEPVVLRGMSTHGLQWYGQFASEGAMESIAARGANVIRLAMYTAENGYLSRPELKEQVTAAVDAAVRQDLYVIIDWHILSDGNPRASQTQAVSFFTEMARRYRDTPNVLYEICNEPNGNVTWSGDVKPYAEAVTAAIRAEDPLGVILIGSPTWSQDIGSAAADPVSGTNLMYTLHFYAGTHGQSLMDRIDAAMDQGIAVFVSEWGTSTADGSGGVFLEESARWLDFLKERGISWCSWSLCDKAETSAALVPGASPEGGWTDADLSESGRFVFSRFRD